MTTGTLSGREWDGTPISVSAELVEVGDGCVLVEVHEPFVKAEPGRHIFEPGEPRWVYQDRGLFEFAPDNKEASDGEAER